MNKEPPFHKQTDPAKAAGQIVNSPSDAGVNHDLMDDMGEFATSRAGKRIADNVVAYTGRPGFISPTAFADYLRRVEESLEADMRQGLALVYRKTSGSYKPTHGGYPEGKTWDPNIGQWF